MQQVATLAATFLHVSRLFRIALSVPQPPAHHNHPPTHACKQYSTQVVHNPTQTQPTPSPKPTHPTVTELVNQAVLDVECLGTNDLTPTKPSC
jgi:hypothetical protein